jgi:hypothetical protein
MKKIAKRIHENQMKYMARIAAEIVEFPIAQPV